MASDFTQVSSKTHALFSIVEFAHLRDVLGSLMPGRIGVIGGVGAENIGSVQPMSELTVFLL